MKEAPLDVTQLLIAWKNGDQAAEEKLVPLVYEELRRLARRYMSREGPGHTLETTALVHEAYLRLVSQKRTRWQNRIQFFGIAAQLMRRILVDSARTRHYLKRGGGMLEVSLDDRACLARERATDLIALDDALTSLAGLDPRKSHVVELRFFGGLSVEETAQFLGISSITVLREWKSAKAWLYREISKGDRSEA